MQANIKVLKMCAVALLLLLGLVQVSVEALGNVEFTPVSKQLETNRNYTFQINRTLEYILLFNITDLPEPPKVWIHSKDAKLATPLMIVALLPKEVLSWQLPLIVNDLDPSEDKSYMTTSRTLCYDQLKDKRNGVMDTINDELVLIVSTVSNRNVSFTVNVQNQEHFRILPSKKYNFTISPSEPRYYLYNFTTNVTNESNDLNYETVIIEVNSHDDICMTVSIQNVSCPVFDTDQDVTFRGFYETVDRKGGLTISKHNFPYGFYIVFVAKSTDYDCKLPIDLAGPESNRVKKVSFIIKPSITYDDYIKAAIYTLCIIGVFYVSVGCIFFFGSVWRSVPRHMDYVNINEPPANQSNSSNTIPILDRGPRNYRSMESIDNDGRIVANTSEDLTEYNVVNGGENETDDQETPLLPGTPSVMDLAMKDPKALKKKSYLYLYNVLMIAIFYGLPVVQFLASYQRVLNETGRRDLCYYNFLCAHPLGLISDFNHLFSNIGYILLGLLFVLITCIRKRSHRDINFDRQFGIPEHYGLFYAMGVALIMEGVLSGSYHICPNQLNFQFDTSFMYVMAVLCVVKLYQNRHPDINATAYATFGVLALAILLAMFGLFEGTIHFWCFFIVIHILTCFYLSLKIYYMGDWKISKASMQRVYEICVHEFWSGPINVLKPHYTDRFVLLVIGNICNWIIAILGIYLRPINFAVFLLAIFLSNTLLYFFFYIVMKHLNGEKARLITWIFLVLSILCAALGMYFFFHNLISWSGTAAQSRQFNGECILFGFYDFHDVWHFLSAGGMFFIFMVLLTLDDDLSHTHRSTIAVF